MAKKSVVVNDRMQRGYQYFLTEPPGKHFAPGFTPDLTPAEMLRLAAAVRKHCEKRPEEANGSA